MINRFDDFTRCTEVVLGKNNYSLLNYIEDKQDRDFVGNILEETDLVLQRLENIFKNFNIKIWRPEVFQHDPEIKLRVPHTKINNVYTSLTPFDNFLLIENTVVEMTKPDKSSMFDHIQYQHIWKNKFEQGSRWISMPKPSYDVNKYDPLDDLPNFEPYADSPSLMICGDTIFVTEQYTVNQLGLDWLKREFPKFKFKIFEGTKGHLDSYFSIVRPGLAISGIPKPMLPTEFKAWDIIEFGKENYNDISVISDHLQDDDYENTVLAVNTFSIDEENFIMMKHVIDQCPDKVRILEKQGINIIPLEFDTCRWLNQGISCLCSAVNRKGGLENYFDG